SMTRRRHDPNPGRSIRMSGKNIETFGDHSQTFLPSPEFAARARIRSSVEYQTLYRESLESPDSFWKRETSELVFRKPWTKLLDYECPFARWFVGAELNVTESCLDKHAKGPLRDKRAIIWESEPGEVRTLSYAELYEQVVRFAAALKHAGIEKGDRVAIYMGMVPEVVIGMLACARIGAPHT